MISNIFMLVGGFLLLLTHFYFSIIGKSKKIFLINILGGFLIFLGAYINNSIPIMILNIFWIFISVLYIYDINIFKNKNHDCKLIKTFILPLIVIIVLILYILGYIDNYNIAYLSTFLYIISFIFFGINIFNSLEYSIYTFLGFLFLLPNIFLTQSYGILLNEGFGALFSFIGIFKFVYLYYVSNNLYQNNH